MGWVVAKAKTKKQDDTLLSYRSQTHVCNTKGPAYYAFTFTMLHYNALKIYL